METHNASPVTPPAPPFMQTHLPWLDLASASCAHVPDDAACRALWEHYDMLPHIGAHCEQVACLAHAVAACAVEKGLPDVCAVTRAAGLLHDIAKTYTVRHGGSHAQIGASWVMAHTGNPVLAQAVMHHVWWPWDFPADPVYPALLVLYADKRVMHDSVVSLDVRFEDLIRRYGRTEASRAAIVAGHAHGQKLERALSAYLEMPLHACTLVGGRLVERT